MTIELTQDEFESLLIALGVAVGTFMKQKDWAEVHRLMRLANAINRNNPNWTPYEVPEEQKSA